MRGPPSHPRPTLLSPLLLILTPLACAAPAPSETAPRKVRPPGPDLVLVGEVLEMRQRPVGVTATVRVERILRGRFYRAEVDCLLGQEWWRAPVREGERYTFRLARRTEVAPNSFVTLPWPHGVSGPEAAGEEGGEVESAGAERLRVLLPRIRSSEVTPEVEREFLEAGRASTPGLLEALRQGDRLTRWNAARLLALIPTPDATADLAALRVDADPNLRMAAASALREIGTPEAREALRSFLGDPSTRVRSIAVEGIGRFRREDDLEAVLPLLEDPSGDVRVEAVRALGRVGGSEAATAIAGLLARAGSNGEIEEEAIDALGRTGSPEAVPALEGVLARGAPGRIGPTVRALARLGEIGVPALLRGLESEDPFVRWRSVSALRSMTGKRFGYRHDAAEEERARAVASWQAWCQ